MYDERKRPKCPECGRKFPYLSMAKLCHVCELEKAQIERKTNILVWSGGALAYVAFGLVVLLMT